MKFPLPFAICAILARTLTLASAAASLPAPTHVAPAIDNWSPAPTAAPQLGNLLFVRDTKSRTCGYFSGLAGMYSTLSPLSPLADSSTESSITCSNPSDVCATNSFYGVHGCCNSASISDCIIATSCIPSTALSTACASLCTIDAAVTLCTASSALECYQLSIIYETATVIQHGCAAEKYTSTAYRIPGLTSSPPADKLVTVTVTSGPGIPTSDSDSAAADSGTSKSHLGPIIGGTVAGCVVVSCLLVSYFIWLRRKRTAAAAAAAAAALSHAPSPAPSPFSTPSPFPAQPVTEYNPLGFAGYTHPDDAKGWVPNGAVWRPEVQRYAVEVDGREGRVEVPG
jgi:hypothetical protein